MAKFRLYVFTSIDEELCIKIEVHIQILILLKIFGFFSLYVQKYCAKNLKANLIGNLLTTQSH